MARHEEGYTLVELLVVIMIFSVVMMLITVSFNRIAASSAQIVKSAETDIGGLIGLELLRRDLELAGFGLPHAFPAGFKYAEADVDLFLVKGCPDNCPRSAAARFNDAQLYPAPGNVPRALQSGDQAGLNGSDYLVLKGTALGMNSVSGSWSYLNYTSHGAIIKLSKSEVELKEGTSARVIVLKSETRPDGATRQLVTDGSDFSLPFDAELPSAFRPRNNSDIYLVYGVDNHPLNPLRFPFNRADYYLSRTANTSSFCAPGTGVLYKSTIDQNGSSTQYPLLDCVLDLQVVFHLDSNGDGEGDLHASDLSGTHDTASSLREDVKEVQVHILAQQGKKDPAYQYPLSDPDRAIVVGAAGPSLPFFGSIWTQSRLASQVGPDWRNYHWKVYSIVVRPKNL
jgi:prepilin-type N-terminal cleavage/methylation domain-containing protein